MKKILLMILVVLAVISTGQAQDKLKIGEIRNGKLVITNPVGLNSHLMNSLGKSGALAKEYQVSTAPEGNRLFLSYAVTGNKDHVTSIGIMLVVINNGVFIVESSPASSPGGAGSGGSFEVQCIGLECNSCLPNLKWINGNWLPYVICECTQNGEGSCNMTSRLVIHVDI